MNIKTIFFIYKNNNLKLVNTHNFQIIYKIQLKENIVLLIFCKSK